MGDNECDRKDFVPAYVGDEKRIKLESKLQPSSAYRFYLVAFNDVGDSQPTDIVNFDTLAEKPE